MSAEFNKVLCAILSAILVLLLSSFISELLYQADTKNKKISYLIEEEIMNDKIEEKVIEKIEKFTFDDIQKLLTKADIVAGEKFATKNCSVCHDFNLPIKNKIGPSLANVVNREIAAIEGYKYSKALKNINQKWTLENLYLFLEKPKVWSPGTKMSYKGISKNNDLVNVLKYLSNITKLNEG